ncbi:unnamed protein product, partial [Closterium sp. NIES-53]
MLRSWSGGGGGGGGGVGGTKGAAWARVALVVLVWLTAAIQVSLAAPTTINDADGALFSPRSPSPFLSRSPPLAPVPLSLPLPHPLPARAPFHSLPRTSERPFRGPPSCGTYEIAVAMWHETAISHGACCAVVCGWVVRAGGVLQEWQAAWGVTMEGWKAGSDCDLAAHTLECSAQGRVLGINVRNRNLTGSLPASIGNLADLTMLDISRNNISGPIPDSISQLKALAYLNMAYNQLSGPIPTGVGQLLKLSVL